MIPIGALAGLAAAAAAHQPSRTKAHVLHGKFVLQPSAGAERGIMGLVLFWTTALAAFFVVIPPGDVWLGVLLWALLAIPLAPALVNLGGRNFFFDYEKLVAVSPWYKVPDELLWRDLEKVWYFGSSFRFRAKNRQVVRIPQSQIGMATLALVVLRCLPESAGMNEKTRLILTSLAQVEGT